MTGIYIIRNIVNNKVYIGQSIDIERRWKEHKRKYQYENERKNSYLYNAIYKYGIESFSFDILEECDKDKLNEREIYYIQKYESTNHNKGYNISSGGNLNAHLLNEKNPNAKMTSEEIWNIRESYRNHCDKYKVYEQYADKISINTFNDIWQGKTWTDIHSDVYTDENKEYHKNNYDKIKSHEQIRKVTDEQVKFVRDEYNKGQLSCTEVFQISGIKNFNTFMDVWNNNTFTYIQSAFPNNREKWMKPKGCQSGSSNNNAKFSQDEIDIIRKMYINGMKVPQIHEIFKTRSSINTIYRIINNETYKTT